MDHSIIDEHGFSIQAVLGSGSEPGWAYTVGFLRLGHPEVIVFGLDPLSASGGLHALHREIAAGHHRPIGPEHPQQLDGEEIRLLAVPESAWTDAADRLATAAAYYDALEWERERLQPVLDPAVGLST